MQDTLDQNTWYEIHSQSASGNAITNSHSFLSPTRRYGSAFSSPYETTDADPSFKYQFFPSPDNSSQYIIRAANLFKSAGSRLTQVWFVGARGSVIQGACGDDCEQTKIGLSNTTGPNALWTVTPTGDGVTHYLTNEANGTQWRLGKDIDGAGAGTWLLMLDAQGLSSNQTSWQFVSAGPINNSSYSTLPSAFASISTTISDTAATTADPLLTPSSVPTTHSTSTSVSAVVGGAVGGFAAVLAILLLILVLLQRRKKRKQQQQPRGPSPLGKELGGVHQVGADGGYVAEAPEQHQIFQAPQKAEEGMGARGAIHELAAEDVARERAARFLQGRVRVW